MMLYLIFSPSNNVNTSDTNSGRLLTTAMSVNLRNLCLTCEKVKVQAMSVSEEAKRRAIAAIERDSAALRELSSEIWNHPELGFQEEHAHALLTRFLEERRFKVERGFTLPTAFRATWGEKRAGGANVAVLCEYDALPGIGHACGHNLIAEAGVAAGLGVQAAIESCAELQSSCVTVLGCPAEEGEGGKINMIDNGCFAGVDCALMVHPFTENAVIINALARSYYRVVFTSSPLPPSHPPFAQPSTFSQDHTSSHPPSSLPTHQHSTTSPMATNSDPNPTSSANCDSTPPSVSPDPNPLDAAVLAYTSLSLLRQQLKPSWKIHGIISNGGAHPDVMPTSVEMLYYFRAASYSELQKLEEKAKPCFSSAALATGCSVSITEESRTYKDVISNKTLSELFLQNSQKLGLGFSKSTQNFSASTDLGNVSHILPSIHPVYSVVGTTRAALHTRDFAALTDTPTAHRSTLLAAQVVAMTAVDILCSPHLLTQVEHDSSHSETTP